MRLPTRYRWRRIGIRLPIQCFIRCGSSVRSWCLRTHRTRPTSQVRSSCTSCSGPRPWGGGGRPSQKPQGGGAGGLPMLAALVVGSVTAVVSVVLLAEAAGLPRAVVLSLAPKSVTAGVAMGISESLHADPSLTAVAGVLTGIMGAIMVTPLMNRMGITDFRARGFAVGIAAHGIGTARAFQVDAVAGVFAGFAMSLNALVTSLLVPLAVTLLVRGP